MSNPVDYKGEIEALRQRQVDRAESMAAARRNEEITIQKLELRLEQARGKLAKVIEVQQRKNEIALRADQAYLDQVHRAYSGMWKDFPDKLPPKIYRLIEEI